MSPLTYRHRQTDAHICTRARTHTHALRQSVLSRSTFWLGYRKSCQGFQAAVEEGAMEFALGEHSTSALRVCEQVVCSDVWRPCSPSSVGGTLSLTSSTKPQGWVRWSLVSSHSPSQEGPRAGPRAEARGGGGSRGGTLLRHALLQVQAQALEDVPVPPEHRPADQ